MRYEIALQRIQFFSIAIVLCLSLGCGGSSEQSAPASSASEAAGQLPPGHPPTGQSAQLQTVRPPSADSGTGANALIWAEPEGWIAETPSSAMRRAQYRVPGDGGDGECVVYYFGPGEGGGAMANAIRWGDQFVQPDGRLSRQALKTSTLEVNGINVLLAEITGTYNVAFPMGGPAKKLPGYMLLGAVAEGPDANWFFKFTGPEATVISHREAFDELIMSFRNSE